MSLLIYLTIAVIALPVIWGVLHALPALPDGVVDLIAFAMSSLKGFDNLVAGGQVAVAADFLFKVVAAVLTLSAIKWLWKRASGNDGS